MNPSGLLAFALKTDRWPVFVSENKFLKSAYRFSSNVGASNGERVTALKCTTNKKHLDIKVLRKSQMFKPFFQHCYLHISIDDTNCTHRKGISSRQVRPYIIQQH